MDGEGWVEHASRLLLRAAEQALQQPAGCCGRARTTISVELDMKEVRILS